MRLVVSRFFREAHRDFPVGAEVTDEMLAELHEAEVNVDYLLARGFLVQSAAPPPEPVVQSAPAPEPVKPKVDSKKPPTEAASLIPPASKTE